VARHRSYGAEVAFVFGGTVLGIEAFG